MSTVGELIHSVKKEDVLAVLDRLYKGERPAEYERVWDQLASMQPKTTGLSVLLSLALRADKPSVPYLNVSGIRAGDDHPLGIEYTDWREWLSMPVIVDPKAGSLTDAEKLANCLYEMTWNGYDYSEAERSAEDLHDIIENLETSPSTPPTIQ